MRQLSHFLLMLDAPWEPRFPEEKQVKMSVRELPVYCQEAVPSRTSPIHGRIPLPFFCWYLAVRCHYHLRIFRYPHSLQFGFVEVFLADHAHPCSGIYHKLSFFRGYRGCGWQNPLIGKRKERSFFLTFELIDVLGKSPRISAGAPLLSFSLLLEICPQISWRRDFADEEF